MSHRKTILALTQEQYVNSNDFPSICFKYLFNCSDYTFSQVFLITFMSCTLKAWTKNRQEKLQVISFITDLNANDIWINAFIVTSFGYLILLIISSCFCLACRDWKIKAKFILKWIYHLTQTQYIYMKISCFHIVTETRD